MEILTRFDPALALHCQRVARLSRLIGGRLRLGDEALEELSFAGLAHDLGIIAVPKRILHKPRRLSDCEYDSVKLHVVAGVAIAQACGCGDWVLQVIRCHHERLDGSGYPVGLGGAELDLFSRIVAVADVYVAMTAPRPYREAYLPEAALAELNNHYKYDADVVRALETVLAY